MLRFYRGGPKAVPDAFFWQTATGRNGCGVAADVGADIPVDSYRGPRRFHQIRVRGSPSGRSLTAILPLEF